jgi:hypothetical protein
METFMRLYHKDNGYHHLAVTEKLEDFLAKGWVLAPKGFQNDRNGTVIVSIDAPVRRGRKPRAVQ